MTEKYYSVEQVADMIDMHPKTIQRYIREGRLKAQKIGKAWRVSGHDLSTFVEGSDGERPTASSGGLQSILGAAADIKVSAVIDIPVSGTAAANVVVSWMSATLNSRSPGSGYASMTTQYIEPERIVRIMLWGDPSFMAVIMQSLGELELEGE